MLKGISWEQFGVFILVVTAVYYLYIGLRFYGYQVLERIGGRRSGAAGLKGKRIGVGGGGQVSAEAGASGEADQAGRGERAGELADMTGSGERADRAGRGERADKMAEGNELFKAMQQAIEVVRLVIVQGAENKLDRENLIDHLHEVLKGYRQLRGSEYAETINNFLVRVCSSELSLALGKGDLAELWK